MPYIKYSIYNLACFEKVRTIHISLLLNVCDICGGFFRMYVCVFSLERGTAKSLGTKNY